MKKVKIAQYSLTCCEGCTVTLLNVLASNPTVFNRIEIVSSRILGYPEPVEADIAFIDGSVITNHDQELLKTIKEKSGIIVALGSCACFGGINALREVMKFNEAIKLVYGYSPNIPHMVNVEPISSIIKVDYYLPGCPPPRNELEQFISCLLLGKVYRLPERPVCFECRAQGIPCLLDEGVPCLGPITRGGCEAACPRTNMPCWGCRGPIDELRPDVYLEAVKDHKLNLVEVLNKVKIFMYKTKARTILGELK